MDALLPVGDAKAAPRADRHPQACGAAVHQGFLVDQRVVKDDIGSRQHVGGAHRQQVRGTRAGANEVDFAGRHSESRSCARHVADWKCAAPPLR